MIKKKIKKIACFLLVAISLALIAGLVYLKANTYSADRAAIQAMASGQPDQDNSVTVFQGQKDKPSLIFYPGALVEPASYSLLAQKLAAEGYTVYLIHPPFNLPVLSSQAALKLIKEYQLDSRQVFLAGHSLGGVMAAANAQQLIEQGQEVGGLILLASYPAQSSDLSQSSQPVLSITASQDHILNWENYKQGQDLLPASSRFQEIKGGNHSGFGLYGQQKGDGPVDLSPLEQQDQLAQLIQDFMAQ